jgi:integrase
MPSLIRDKSGTFFIVTSENGKRVWRSTRTRDRREAYQLFLAQSPTSRGNPTLSKCASEFLAHVKTNSAPKTHKVYKLALQHLFDFIGDVAIEQVSTRDIDRYKSQRIEKVSPATLNIEIRCFRAFFNRLRRWEILSKNPCDGVSQIRIPDQLPPFFTFEQIKKIQDNTTEDWLYRVVTFAAMTGARLGEILNLSWEDIDVENRVCVIRSNGSFRVKSGKARTIPLNETVYEMIMRSSHREGLVFPGKRGQKVRPNYVSRKFREIVRAAGLDKKLHFHSLRHTFASLLVKRGVSLYQVQKLLGHSSPRVTEVYAHLQGSDLHGAVSKIALF